MAAVYRLQNDEWWSVLFCNVLLHPELSMLEMSDGRTSEGINDVSNILMNIILTPAVNSNIHPLSPEKC